MAACSSRVMIVALSICSQGQELARVSKPQAECENVGRAAVDS